MPPKGFCDYINSFFPDIKNNSNGENVVQNLDVIFELVEDSFSEKIVDIEQFTKSFLRLEIPNISYSLYAASYDYIYKVFEILTGGNKKDLFTDELVEYIDKIHINLWDVSRHKPFWFIRLMNIRVGTDIIIKGLFNTNWSSFFIKILPKGIKKLENIKDLFEKSKDWWIGNKEISSATYSKVVRKYSRDEKSCFVIAIMDNKDYISLSGFDYDGKILEGVKSYTERYKKIMNIVEKNILARDAIHCNLNDLTKRYTETVDNKKPNSIKYIKSYSYLKDDLKREFLGNSVPTYNWSNVTEDRRNDYGYTFGCCERKILGKVLPEGQESIKQKIVFFSRWAPCEKCRPAIFALENNCYYAYADSYKESAKYNLSRYYVEENPNETNEKRYEIIKEELKKDIDSSSKVQQQENDCAADNNVQLQGSDADIKIYDDQYRICNLYRSDYKGEEFELGYSIQIKSYLLKPKYRYIQIGIDEKEGISIFCDKEEGKAFIGFKYTFLSKLGIKSVYDGDIYYWGERSIEEFLKKELLGNFLDLQNNNILGEIVDVDVTKIVDVYMSPNYEESKFLVLRQSFGGDKKSTIESIVFNPYIKDIDISMCKYGMDRLSKVKKIFLCSNDNRDILVKIIEACRIDKILNEIESRRQLGSEIEKERRKLRDSIEKTIYGLNGSECEFDGISIYILN